MKAVDTYLLTFLEGRKQFQIPIYQRTYSWNKKHCERLLQDIILTGERDGSTSHFIGSVVYFQPEDTPTSSVPKYLVIDGQQRLTTITLLLTAIREFIKEHSDCAIEGTSAEEIQDSYLSNPHRTGDDKFKLLLTKKDKDTLIKVLEGLSLDESAQNTSRRIQDNYKYFCEEINLENIQKIFNGIRKLTVIDATLEFEKDNPQLIFESLNSTGLNLSQADLIRNFVIMGQSQEMQTKIYEQSWYPMETLFGDDINKMTNFFRDYLTITLGEIPKKDEVYEKFKSYIKSIASVGSLNIEEKAKEFLKFAGYYTNFSLDKEVDKDLKPIFANLRDLKVEVSYPLVLALYIDFKEDCIEKQNFISMLKMIESYVFRRTICDIPTNSLNRTFPTFHKGIDKKDYMNSFKAKFHLLEGYKRFPKNEEFSESLKKKNIYHSRNNLCLYFLDKLENHERREKVNVKEYTIEHVMPQAISSSLRWQKELGNEWKRIHTEKLHTIGNLTLTGYNSEMSNKSFEKKQKDSQGFHDSPLKLNESLRLVECWNEDSIIKREKELIHKAIEIFQDFPLSENILNRYRESKEEYRIEQFQMPDKISNLYKKLTQRILNLDPQVYEEVKKRYIAYKADTNFVDIIPQKSILWLTINMDTDQIDDPEERCKDITGKGTWGNGNTRMSIAKESDIEYAMNIVRQSLNSQLN